MKDMAHVGSVARRRGVPACLGASLLRETVRDGMVRAHCRMVSRARVLMSEERGQGTTEYAILVGVIVVIAIVAVTAFKGKIQELWTAITDGINSL